MFSIVNIQRTISRAYCLATLFFCLFVIFPQVVYCGNVAGFNSPVQLPDGVFLESSVLDVSVGGNFVSFAKEKISEFFDGVMSFCHFKDDEGKNASDGDSDDFGHMVPILDKLWTLPIYFV